MSDVTPEHREKVSRTFDSELDARIHAQSLWDRRRKALVMTTLNWNQANPDRKVRTANRYVVIEEVR